MLRHQVTIEQLVRDPSVGGADTWRTYAAAWASIEPLRGREYFAAQEMNAEVTGTIRIRYIPGVKPDMRVSFGQCTFEVLAVVDPDERHRELQLLVKEVQ